ncbi:hypothetical protein Syun_011774 [Stephania yunnanensis]|uniref:Uncharacterized protein n=1 Tax=Stephania yunnanensis TaxID=152371 RepID=A0AAP0PGU5_9MAGN
MRARSESREEQRRGLKWCKTTEQDQSRAALPGSNVVRGQLVGGWGFGGGDWRETERPERERVESNGTETPDLLGVGDLGAGGPGETARPERRDESIEERRRRR